jgi:Txe/YoeB family toxin of Txe-Axe toxin-antitoxin module
MAKFFAENVNFINISKKEEILSFLDIKIKTKEEDPDGKWMRTWNDYLQRIKYFFRWLHNEKLRQEKYGDENSIDPSDWITLPFLKIKEKKSKRISPYLESEIWDKDDFQTIIKYEPLKRNKAALSLLWDLDARPHEISGLKIKHVKLKQKYGEGEIPFESKTGTGPVLLTFSFPYVRDWINEHPFKNEPNASIICNQITGAPIHADALNNFMKHLKGRIQRLIKSNQITDQAERERLYLLLKVKKWNPYCIRHSAITADSDYLPEYALKKKVRWSMNSKQGARYIKRRMGNELKNKILEYNGIITEEIQKKKSLVLNCPRCEITNTPENKYCSDCSYPLVPEAFDEIKRSEDEKIDKLRQDYDKNMTTLREEMNDKFVQILSMIQNNPLLAYIKPEILEKQKNTIT